VDFEITGQAGKFSATRKIDVPASTPLKGISFDAFGFSTRKSSTPNPAISFDVYADELQYTGFATSRWTRARGAGVTCCGFRPGPQASSVPARIAIDATAGQPAMGLEAYLPPWRIRVVLIVRGSLSVRANATIAKSPTRARRSPAAKQRSRNCEFRMVTSLIGPTLPATVPYSFHRPDRRESWSQGGGVFEGGLSPLRVKSPRCPLPELEVAVRFELTNNGFAIRLGDDGQASPEK
jgi:hypothetical protein